MANYYCQVAGLPDVAFDGSKAAFTVERFRDELYPALSARDAKCVDLLFLSIDNANILDILKHGEEAKVANTDPSTCPCAGCSSNFTEQPVPFAFGWQQT